MDRQIVYPGAIPLDTDILGIQVNTMVALGQLIYALFGGNTVVDGLQCTATVPAAMQVQIAGGMMTELASVDTTAFGSLGADTADPLMKMAIILGPTVLAMPAPTGGGNAINYLVEAAFSESDTDLTVLPYYNAANPTVAYSGPNNTGVAQNTQRIQRVLLQVKAGVQATAGSQVTPTADAGYIGLYSVTVTSGMYQITGGAISMLPTAPFLKWRLQNLSPGFGGGVAAYLSNDTFVVPAGVHAVQVELWGGGSGSWASTTTVSGGGGGAGGYTVKNLYGLNPGDSIAVTIGNGGAQGTSLSAPGAGGMSAFGGYVSATGGTVNPSSSLTTPQYGNLSGIGINGDLNLYGDDGASGFPAAGSFGGMGGGSPRGAGSINSGTTGRQGRIPGGGASGAGNPGGTSYPGAAGGSGFCLVRW